MGFIDPVRVDIGTNESELVESGRSDFGLVSADENFTVFEVGIESYGAGYGQFFSSDQTDGSEVGDGVGGREIDGDFGFGGDFGETVIRIV